MNEAEKNDLLKKMYQGSPNGGQVGPKIEVQEVVPPKSKKRRRRGLKLTLGFIALLILIMGGFVLGRAANLSEKIFVGQKSSFYSRLADLFKGSGGNVKLVGEDLGQVNVLLLGIGGEGHDGPYLSDTMIVAQIRPDINKATLISIPRDYLATLPQNYGMQKINAAFAEGFNQHKDYNEAGSWARQAVEQVTGLTIPYFAVVDFSGFEKAVDLVGGVDVHVDRTFTDYSYPDSGTGYLPPQTFTEGDQHMDGKHALIFARSRHAAGIEGSDFARSQRQQKIIAAMKAKVTQINLISDLGTLNNLASIVGDHFHTNISPGELLRLYDITKAFGAGDVVSLSLDPSTNLICPEILPDNGAYVLVPCQGHTVDDIKQFFAGSFSAQKPAENTVIWLADTTVGKTKYKAVQKILTDDGYTVYGFDFAGKPLTESVAYQVNQRPQTMAFLTQKLGLTEVTLPPPGLHVDKTRVDLIIVLGGDATSSGQTPVK